MLGERTKEEQFQRLVTVVGQIDESAAEYLRSQKSHIMVNNRGLRNIDNALIWRNTPQGSDFWMRIDTKTERLLDKFRFLDMMDDLAAIHPDAARMLQEKAESRSFIYRSNLLEMLVNNHIDYISLYWQQVIADVKKKYG